MRLLITLLLCFHITSYAQSDTDVILFDITPDGETFKLSNKRNMSNNEGYDNQPSFYNDNQVLFASTRNRQTDIGSYNVRDNKVAWINDTQVGSEYSPTKIPGQKAISAIRLDTTGLQRLYRYDFKTGQSEMLVKDLVIGYHVWINTDELLAAVLAENRLDLVHINVTTGKHKVLKENVGRSLHKIPNTALLSYVDKSTDNWTIRSIDPKTGASEKILNIGIESEDMCWLLDGTILLGYKNYLLKFNAKYDENWVPLKIFTDPEVSAISRLATNATSTMLAIVSEESPAKVIEKQVIAFNARDLDAFINCFSKDVVVKRYPSDTMYIGRQALKENYTRFYSKHKSVAVEVTKRMISGNKIVDEEKVIMDGNVHRQATIYEVENGTIKSMTFTKDGEIHEVGSLPGETPEQIVQRQLIAYNARDIDAFLNTYADDVVLMNFPNEIRSKGKQAMREGYTDYFENTEDLHCEIKNRIVIGNKVIDEEYITSNGRNFKAVAIYEVENGKISKVTFL